MRSGGLWKTNVQFKTKDKMENKISNLLQNPPFCKADVSRLLLLFDQMIKEENEALGKAGFYNQYGRETHANNKYCLAIVKSLIERRFGNSG